MNLFYRGIDLVLYSSMFTACCALGLCMATESLVNNAVPLLVTHLHGLVFGSSLVVYNAPKLVKHGNKSRISRTWYIIFFFGGASLALASLLHLSASVVVLSVVLGVFAFAYSLPLLPFKNRKRLREFGWLKIIVLAGVWTTATSVLPIVHSGQGIGSYPFEILLRFTFIFALCVVFDIRDIHTDLQSNIDTLPHKVGIQNSYKLIYIALTAFVLLGILQYYRFQHPARLADALLTAVITGLVVLYLKKHPSERAYLLLADGVMVVYSLLVLFH